MTSSLTTTYFGHDICIEPFEWGCLAHVVKPGSGDRLIAANASAMQALEDAFELVDDSLRSLVFPPARTIPASAAA